MVYHFRRLNLIWGEDRLQPLNRLDRFDHFNRLGRFDCFNRLEPSSSLTTALTRPALRSDFTSSPGRTLTNCMR